MEAVIKTPKIKICGITDRAEAEYLNEAGVDYAGFVFYEKSRRNISLGKAEQIMKYLDRRILKAAVVVNPDADFAKEAETLGFDILQVHGNLEKDIRSRLGIPIWRAVNITDSDALHTFFEKEAKEDIGRIEGYVVDGAGYGSGRPFDWMGLGKSVQDFVKSRKLILAGGLTEENVTLGMRIFWPDIVDVSSGVEENGRKSRKKIKAFVRKVREDE